MAKTLKDKEKEVLDILNLINKDGSNIKEIASQLDPIMGNYLDEQRRHDIEVFSKFFTSAASTQPATAKKKKGKK